MIHLCDKCNKIAVWDYVPNSRYCCDDHVPRGCSCNIDENGIEPVDEKGRLFPCCEWDYSEKGFRVHDD